MWGWLSRSLRPTVIWQIKALWPPFLSGHTSGDQKKKNYKLMIFCCWVIFLGVLSAFPVDCWFDSWAVESMPFSECEGESWGWRYVPHLGTFRQGCIGPPASPQMSRDQGECLVWLMKFGLFTAPQSHSYPCQFLGQMEYWEWNVGREFRFLTWLVSS